MHQVPAGLTRGLPLDDYVAIASFVFFGIKAILDAVRATGGQFHVWIGSVPTNASGHAFGVEEVSTPPGGGEREISEPPPYGARRVGESTEQLVDDDQDADARV